MWRALLIDGLPSSPSTMSSDSCAMSCLVTSLAIFLPRRGLTKRRRWLAMLPSFRSGAASRRRPCAPGSHPLDALVDDLIDGDADSLACSCLVCRGACAMSSPLPIRAFIAIALVRA